MKKLTLILLLCIISLSFSFAQKKSKAIPVIFDSDMGPDYDDVGAIAMLHAFADSGYVKILATVSSTGYDGVAGVFNVLNTYFNRPNLPVAVCHNGLKLRDTQHWTDTLLAKFPHKISSNDEVPEAVDLYRKLLSGQADNSVTIVTVGFLTNLSNLLKSTPDKYSKLPGRELVQRKVKQLVSMAGVFPSGKEFNVEKDAQASQFVFSEWPGAILLSGFEIGQKIKVGVPLSRNEKILNSPVKEVFSISIPKSKSDSAGRMSWDETAVLTAVKGYKPYYRLKRGTMVVHEDGSNTWNEEGSQHAHLVENVAPKQVETYIEKLISHQPMKKKSRRANTK